MQNCCRRLESLNTAPILSFALKVVAAQEVAAAAAAAFAEAVDQQGGKKVESVPAWTHSYILQVLVDCELLAAALDAQPPFINVRTLPAATDALPLTIRKAVEAGVGGQRSAEVLKEAARQGRRWLCPRLNEKLE